MVFIDSNIWLKKHKKLPNGEEQCCKRQKQRDCPRCNVSKHIHVNLRKKDLPEKWDFPAPTKMAYHNSGNH